MKYKQFSTLAIALICLVSISFGQNYKPPAKGELIIFHAGSLSVPMKEITASFNQLNPNVKVWLESAGSVASARKITDLDKPCDILISADYGVIDKMLIPKYADWNIKFASNELSIVYSSKSKYASLINSNNWFEILMKEDVAFGRADPNSDPCGYRTVLALKLAEKYYKKPGLAAKMFAKDQNYIRPKEVDLLALLETGSIDFIFIYRSVAIQHQLSFVTLPDQVNLKNPKYANYYATVSTEINGSAPGLKEKVVGEPMIYGITLLKNAPNKDAALAFLKFMLSREQGMKIMVKNGQPSVIPLPARNYDKIPKELKQFATK